MNEQISVKERWGHLRPGMNYNVLSEGIDWTAVKHNGGVQYVPRYLVDRPIVHREEEIENLNPLFNF